MGDDLDDLHVQVARLQVVVNQLEFELSDHKRVVERFIERQELKAEQINNHITESFSALEKRFSSMNTTLEKWSTMRETLSKTLAIQGAILVPTGALIGWLIDHLWGK